MVRGREPPDALVQPLLEPVHRDVHRLEQGRDRPLAVGQERGEEVFRLDRGVPQLGGPLEGRLERGPGRVGQPFEMHPPRTGPSRFKRTFRGRPRWRISRRASAR